jgi:hypothetical protein
VEVRPVGTSFLHVPFVLIGGDYTFWLSRYFVWFEFACISWCWVLILEKLTLGRLNNIERILTGLVVFSFCAHDFPPMVWGTTDGMFFVSVGLLFALKEKFSSKFFGYFLIGFACLCKQGFLLMVPAALIASGDWKRMYYWIVAVLPGLIYLSYLAVNKALGDALFQLTSRSDLLFLSVYSFIINWMLPWGIILGFLIMKILNPQFNSKFLQSSSNYLKIAGIVIMSAILFFAAYMLGVGKYHIEIPMFLLGITAGILLYNVMGIERKQNGLIRLTFLIVAYSVSSSFSQGYNTPAFAGGASASVIMYLLFHEFKAYKKKAMYYALYTIITASVLVGFIIARENYVYRDLPAKYLTEDIGDVFPGGKCIKTNKNTKRFLADLQKTGGETYSIVPQIPGYWVHSEQLNPLPADIPCTEFGSASYMKLYGRLVKAVEEQRGKICFIVQKVDAGEIRDRWVPLDPDLCTIAFYIRGKFQKINETEFFEIYR